MGSLFHWDPTNSMNSINTMNASNSSNPTNRSTLIKVIVALLFIGLLAKMYYDTNSIEVKHYQIKESSLGEALAGLKVAFLSDLHIRKIDVRENKILEILNEEKPDLILLSGDYISFKGPYEPVMSFFHQLKPPYGAYAVLGNTEYSNENGSCVLCHNEKSKSLKDKENPIFLRNSFLPLKINGKILNIQKLVPGNGNSVLPEVWFFDKQLPCLENLEYISQEF
jgi:hypothetical protein